MRLSLHTIVAVIAMTVLGSLAPALSQANEDRMFPYPDVPPTKERLDERCNYLVYHFWERCNMKQAMSMRARLDKAFGDWCSFMPYATADTVHLAIDNLLGSISKNGAQTLEMARIAERWMYADSAEYKSEELFYPFAVAVSNNKKISSADKARYAAIAKVLESSKIGDKAPNFEFETADGGKTMFHDVAHTNTLLILADPDCSDCHLSTVRLAADHNIKTLNEAGVLDVVCIYTAGDAEQWQAACKALPDFWVGGHNEEIDEILTLTTYPQIYLIDPKGTIVSKNVSAGEVLDIMDDLNRTLQEALKARQ